MGRTYIFIIFILIMAAGCAGLAEPTTAGTAGASYENISVGSASQPTRVAAGSASQPACVAAGSTSQPPRVICRELKIPEADAPPGNPFMGWCPWACANKDKYTPYQPHTLVFSLIDWRIFEPQEGVYDVAALKKSMYYDVWAADHKFVIRPVLDYPDGTEDDPDIDLPGWLYDKMTEQEDSAGARYDNSYGIGFSPNYSSKILLDAHQKFMAELGKTFDKDPAVAFVELGSVGHWGEWHTNYGAGVPRLPLSSITDLYVKDYINAFPDKKLLMRKPYAIAKNNSLGLYDDSFLLDNAKWLQWINFGLLDEATKENHPAMPDFWRASPSGGEMGSGTKPKALGDPKTLVDWIKKCHTTFIGPSSLANSLKNKDEIKAADIARNAMGYCLRVETVKMELSADTAVLTAVWVNDGVAPFYYPWPIVLELADAEGSSLHSETTGWDIREIMPDMKAEFKITLDAALFYEKDVTIKVAVMDPDSNAPGVYLAQGYPDGKGAYRLMEIAGGVISLPK